MVLVATFFLVALLITLALLALRHGSRPVHQADDPMVSTALRWDVDADGLTPSAVITVVNPAPFPVVVGAEARRVTRFATHFSVPRTVQVVGRAPGSLRSSILGAVEAVGRCTWEVPLGPQPPGGGIKVTVRAYQREGRTRRHQFILSTGFGTTPRGEAASAGA